MNKNKSILRRFLYSTVLVLVPVLAVPFLGICPSTLPSGMLDAQAFAPLSRTKDAASKPTAAGDDVPVVKLNAWEYTAFRVSSGM